jgi:predicted MFS family arabinose efflux permease
MVGFGLSALGFPVILGAIGRTTPESHRSLFLGIATAGGSFGQVLVAPVSQVALDAIGWVNTLLILAAVCGLSAFLALGLRLETRSASRDGTSELPFGQTLRLAMRHQGFLLLVTGFFVCGFQLAFISFHLPAFAAFCGLPARAGALGISLIGLFNIMGSVGAGKLGGVWRPKFPLSAIYALRALAIGLFMLIPVSEFSLYLFAAAMGILWLSTIPLTSGVIGQIFGPRYVGTLFGIAFFSHQLGSFVGLWLTGIFLEAFGTYDAIWWTAAALGLFAAAVHLPIDDRRLASPASA